MTAAQKRSRIAQRPRRVAALKRKQQRKNNGG